MSKTIDIAEDITIAQTLPPEFYTDEIIFQKIRKNIFERSWQLVTDTDNIKVSEDIFPFTFIENFIEEPLLFTRDKTDKIHCLSNVCTHRANLLVKNPTNSNQILCSYHGRRFDLAGKFRSMPECDGMKNFPSERDHLSSAPFAEWKKFLFASINPVFPFDELIKEMQERLYWLPFEQIYFEPSRSQDYLIKANWALYCDNYLEGFHIPFVHKELAKVIDYGAYQSEIFKYSNLQIGIGKGGDDVFDIPKNSPDYGKNIAGYYFWLFPNTMFNFYPWGISINIVKPIAVNLTKVSYRTYIWDASKLDKGAGGALEKVEREDQNIVENVQRGITSKLYHRGRFSPKMEQGVHHFHRLVAEFLK